MYFENRIIERYIEQSDAFVFDLNGLIVDDEPIQLQATNDVLAPYGIRLDEPTWISQCVGRKPAEYLPGFVGASVNIAGIIAAKDSIYFGYVTRDTAKLARPGALSLITYLHAQAKPLALATSTTRAGTEAILGHGGLSILDRFDVVVTGDQVTRAKPDPEIYNLVRSNWKEPHRYLAFEDSEAGVLSAARSGMHCVAVPNTFTLSQNMSAASVAIDNMMPSARLLHLRGENVG